MSQSPLLEIARLRSLVARLMRQYGEAETLAMLEKVIETEVVRKTNE